MVGCDPLIAHLTARIDEVLEPLLPAGEPCALLDYPFHSNVGDSAIWVGEKRWLAARDIDVIYEADAFSYREAAVRALDPSIPILLHGGGSFGDVWPIVEAARERVLTQLADRRLIQLPQTIHFADPARLERARGIINRLSDFTLLCRDNHSLEFARTNFECRSILCPDMAFVMGSQQPPVEPLVDCVWLARTDKETALPANTLPHGVEAEDWLIENETELPRARWEALRRVVGGDVPDIAAMAAFAQINLQLAEARVTRGLKQLSRGRGVITDRLHAHVLSLLLAKPHILIDNSYGKNRNFYETWTSDCELGRLETPGASSAEALLTSLRSRLGTS